ncbi:hypothetical protein [Gilliamella sp. ESL0405]|uniref:hypothetical protein n=1 Tax=Gilliamella sp. ESL0405 TaxID=2704653 RepID=UPI001C6A71D1|nr:hypothetical protein [Gilliamella sp. ESL0405]QYN47560.1 hypothetical protein GYM74_10285 [Gilliamella sp. ESL0405]
MKNYCYFLLFLFLTGCDSSHQPFDRFKAFESSPPMFAPVSHYMKQQTIKTEVDGKLDSIQVFKYTKSGDILSANGNYINSDVFGISFEYDYEKNKFKLYNHLFRVNITDGNFIRNHNNQIIEYTGDNDHQIFKNDSKYKTINNYQDKKLIQSLTKVGKIINKVSMYWENDLPIKSESLLYNSNELRIINITDYLYNEKKQIEKMILTIVMGNKKIVGSETYFYDYNEYGDWIKSTTIRKNQGSNKKVTTVRDIEYW